MKNSAIKKLILFLLFNILNIFAIEVFAADPSFSLSITSGTQLKLHCNYVIGIMINPGGQTYNGFDSTLKFDQSNATLNHISINSFFTSTTSGYIKSGYLYRAYGVRPAGAGNSVLQAATFGFKTLNNITTTTLEFTTLDGGNIIFDKNTTDDGAVINSSISSLDILTGITNATYYFTPLPCIIDTDSPIITNTNPSNGARYIATGYQVGFLVYDWIGAGSISGPSPLGTNNRSHYRYSGLNTSLSNYQSAPSTVDNQAGVNSGSIRVTVACPTCAGSWSYTLTGNLLTIISWTGNISINKYTRDSKDRGYLVSFDPPAPYEIEKQVNVNIQVSDHPNELGITHTGTYSFSFNAPSIPTFTRLQPATSNNVDRATPIVFIVSDDWAGIDPTTISITIPQILSGSTVIYTGYTYSGNELTIQLTGGAPGIGNSGSYQVSFFPKRKLPSNTTISLTGSVSDYSNNIGTYTSTFTTSMSCADWGCTDMFFVHILEGTNIGNYLFTGTLIIITGTNINSPYPYLTGTNNNILMCGLPYTGTILTGNIGIYDTTGNLINGSIYTNNILYITGDAGLNFIYDNGTIVIQ